jgi:hypothetical protein
MVFLFSIIVPGVMSIQASELRISPKVKWRNFEPNYECAYVMYSWSFAPLIATCEGVIILTGNRLLQEKLAKIY